MPPKHPVWRLPLRIAAGLLLASGLALAAGAWLHADVAAGDRGLPVAEGELPPLPAVARAEASAPRVAVAVRGVGLAEAATHAALALPPEIALAFSPYARRLDEWRAQASDAGHEIWVELPLEPADPSRADAGEFALHLQQDEAARLAGLDRILDRMPDASGVVAEAGAFARQPEAFVPLARAMTARSLGFVELGGPQLQDAVAAAGGSYAVADFGLDAEPAPEAVDAVLAEMEEQARRSGGAIGHVYAHPSTLARLAAWVHRIGDQGLRLVPLGEAVARPAAGGSDKR